jgi:ABC-type Fe3+/spermidine/putrescine transport system ATPase subunit
VGGAPGPACVSIRPQDIAVEAPGRGLAAKVIEREFLGNIARYRMQAGGQVLVVEVPHRRGSEPHQAGDAVGLLIDPKQVSVLR